MLESSLMDHGVVGRMTFFIVDNDELNWRRLNGG
jgi:hypothetical protein